MKHDLPICFHSTQLRYTPQVFSFPCTGPLADLTALKNKTRSPFPSRSAHSPPQSIREEKRSPAATQALSSSVVLIVFAQLQLVDPALWVLARPCLQPAGSRILVWPGPGERHCYILVKGSTSSRNLFGEVDVGGDPITATLVPESPAGPRVLHLRLSLDFCCRGLCSGSVSPVHLLLVHRSEPSSWWLLEPSAECSVRLSLLLSLPRLALTLCWPLHLAASLGSAHGFAFLLSSSFRKVSRCAGEDSAFLQLAICSP
ncbi:hypothetical protein CC79DRAFT_1108972 [Sarocladium strictum]